MTRIAVIGLSDSLLELAVSLKDAGADVAGFDSHVPQYVPIPVSSSVEEAVEGADIVLVQSAPHLALSTAEKISPVLKAGAIYADFSAGTPDLKQRIAQTVPEGACADAALVAEVGVETAGPAAMRMVSELTALSLPAYFISDRAGDVATRQLLRNLLAKSLTGALTDTLWAAESIGLQDFAWQEIQRQFEGMTAASAQELINDAAHNFKRHQIEMQDVVEILAQSGYESTMIAPIQFTHGRIMHGKKIPHAQPPAKKS